MAHRILKLSHEHPAIRVPFEGVAMKIVAHELATVRRAVFPSQNAKTVPVATHLSRSFIQVSGMADICDMIHSHV